MTRMDHLNAGRRGYGRTPRRIEILLPLEREDQALLERANTALRLAQMSEETTLRICKLITRIEGATVQAGRIVARGNLQRALEGLNIVEDKAPEDQVELLDAEGMRELNQLIDNLPNFEDACKFSDSKVIRPGNGCAYFWDASGRFEIQDGNSFYMRPFQNGRWHAPKDDHTSIFYPVAPKKVLELVQDLVRLLKEKDEKKTTHYVSQGEVKTIENPDRKLLPKEIAFTQQWMQMAPNYVPSSFGAYCHKQADGASFYRGDESLHVTSEKLRKLTLKDFEFCKAVAMACWGEKALTVSEVVETRITTQDMDKAWDIVFNAPEKTVIIGESRFAIDATLGRVIVFDNSTKSRAMTMEDFVILVSATSESYKKQEERNREAYGILFSFPRELIRDPKNQYWFKGDFNGGSIGVNENGQWTMYRFFGNGIDNLRVEKTIGDKTSPAENVGIEHLEILKFFKEFIANIYKKK